MFAMNMRGRNKENRGLFVHCYFLNVVVCGFRSFIYYLCWIWFSEREEKPRFCLVWFLWLHYICHLLHFSDPIEYILKLSIVFHTTTSLSFCGPMVRIPPFQGGGSCSIHGSCILFCIFFFVFFRSHSFFVFHVSGPKILLSSSFFLWRCK